MGSGDPIARRLLALAECVRELDRPECCDAARLAADATLRAAVERWVQVGVEACIDVAAHVIAREQWTPPASARDAFRVLAAHGRMPVELAGRLGRAAGLRNLLVHDYVDVDVDRLCAVVRGGLDDLRAFAQVAAGWVAEG